MHKHEKLSQTELYRYFHRHRAKRKNEAINNLLKTGYIKQEIARVLPNARKPTQFFSLSEMGIDYAIEKLSIPALDVNPD